MTMQTPRICMENRLQSAAGRAFCLGTASQQGIPLDKAIPALMAGKCVLDGLDLLAAILPLEVRLLQIEVFTQ